MRQRHINLAHRSLKGVPDTVPSSHH